MIHFLDGSRLLERPYYSWYRIKEEERDQGRQRRINAANSIAAMNSGAPSSASSESLEPQSSFSSVSIYFISSTFQ